MSNRWGKRESLKSWIPFPASNIINFVWNSNCRFTSCINSRPGWICCKRWHFSTSDGRWHCTINGSCSCTCCLRFAQLHLGTGDGSCRLFVIICISSSESWCVPVLLNMLVKLDNSLCSCIFLLNKKSSCWTNYCNNKAICRCLKVVPVLYFD